MHTGYSVETTTNAYSIVKERLERFCRRVLYLDHDYTNRGAVAFLSGQSAQTVLMGIEAKHSVRIYYNAV